MALTLTFLGKGGVGRTTMAIAAAKKLSVAGQRVLLAEIDPSPAISELLGVTTSSDPRSIAPNFDLVHFQTTHLIDQGWDKVKQLEAKYLRYPILKDVYSQELAIFPGLDSLLNLMALREYHKSGKYDVIIYDGTGDEQTIRITGLPETMGWYVRRFKKVLLESDLWKTLNPFLTPIALAVLNINLFSDNFSEPTKEVNDLLEEGKAYLGDPSRLVAYLVTNDDPIAIAKAKYLWGSAQQVGLSVGGVLVNQSLIATDLISQEFSPLSITNIPKTSKGDWSSIIQALPDLRSVIGIPKPIDIDLYNRQVRLFLPGFKKNQVKVTQYGPEITIEAGDIRRNLYLPSPLTGQPIKSAKFLNSYLTMEF